MSSSGFYTTKEAARITGVPPSTINYWARTALITPTHGDHPRLFSFADLRDLAVADQLRKQDAHVRHLRRALTYVRSHSDQSRLAHMNFGVHDKGLVWANEEGEVVAPHLEGHGVFVVDMRAVYDLLGMSDPQVMEMRPAQRIQIDPTIRGGTPVIAGTRIPASLVAELFNDGVTVAGIQEMYPSLSEEDIDAAVEWERPGKAAAG